MASMTMTASLLGCSTSITAKHPSATARRSVVIAKASSAPEGEKANSQIKSIKSMEQSSAGRRDLVFAAAAAAACSVAKAAMAEEPKRGTPEAKKKYGPICVTMPTARICHK